MEKKRFHNALQIAGTIFIILGIIAYYNGLKHSGITGVLWFSYTALFLIGIGIVRKNPSLIASQVNIILIPYIFWNIDFFYVLITSESLFGITNYFFQQRPLLSQIITLQHLFIIPISFFALYKYKLKDKGFWKISLLEIVVLFFLIRILEASENINCVFESCIPLQISIIPYPVAWFLFCTTFILLTNYFLSKMFLKKNVR